ncbi:hypothetical protein AB0E01_22535 [Nocardia vinacea]|uniref:hypothetical protein n=1 Tax=Nocardia vinacea TaxID=96468 RepID=UPI0033F41009
MTCIAALIADGVGYIAGDSLGSNDSTQSVYRNRKVFRRGDFLIGCAGSYRLTQILQYGLVVPARRSGRSLEDYLYVDFVDAVRAALDDSGLSKVPSGCSFLIVAESRIFTFQADLSLLESEDPFEACGSGEDYARATMWTMLNHGIGGPEQILTEAIESASRYVPNVGGPVHHLRMPEVAKVVRRRRVGERYAASES